MCRLLSWSSKASRRSSNCISNSCSSMRTDFLKLCSWSASYLDQVHHKKNKGIHCTQLHTTKRELSGTVLWVKDFIEGNSKWNTENSSFMEKLAECLDGTKVLLHLYKTYITSWRKLNNKVYHGTFSNFSFKCLNRCKQKKSGFMYLSNQIQFKTSNNKNHRAMHYSHITSPASSPAWF